MEQSYEKECVDKIGKCWCRYRDKQMFKLLKHAITAADHSLTHDIIRKINPNEAELLDDPVFKTKIRFRFAGVEFPPYVVFKVYIQTNGRGVKYLCGKKVIKSSSQASTDSCSLMGNRKYLDLMLVDLCEEQQCQINDEYDITNMKDYMKYKSIVDEAKPESGGRANTWRTLTLEVVPRHHIISDVLLYIHHGKKSENFINNFYPRGSSALVVPLTQTQQVEYINMLSKRKHVTSPNETSRRSKQAKERVAKMKRLYKQHKEGDGEESDREFLDNENMKNMIIKDTKDEEKLVTVCPVSPLIKATDIDFDDEDWDEEGDVLFEWTKNLSFTNLQTSRNLQLYKFRDSSNGDFQIHDTT